MFNIICFYVRKLKINLFCRDYSTFKWKMPSSRTRFTARLRRQCCWPPTLFKPDTETSTSPSTPLVSSPMTDFCPRGAFRKLPLVLFFKTNFLFPESWTNTKCRGKSGTRVLPPGGMNTRACSGKFVEKLVCPLKTKSPVLTVPTTRTILDAPTFCYLFRKIFILKLIKHRNSHVKNFRKSTYFLSNIKHC